MEMLLAISSDEERFVPLFEVSEDLTEVPDDSVQRRLVSRSPRLPSYREALQCPPVESERLRPPIIGNRLPAAPPSIPSPSIRYLRARNSGETNSFGRHANHREITQIEEDAHLARQLQKNEIFQTRSRSRRSRGRRSSDRSPSPTHVFLSPFQAGSLGNDAGFGGPTISSSESGSSSSFGFLPIDENSNSPAGWVASASTKDARPKGKQSFTNGLASVTNWCRSKFKKPDNGTTRDCRSKVMGSTNRSFSLSEQNDEILKAPESKK